MKTIKFIISLEDFKARRINTIPSIQSNIKLSATTSDDIYKFDKDKLIEGDDKDFMLNYGMFPSNVSVPTNVTGLEKI